MDNIKTSEELYRELLAFRNVAHESVVAFMKAHNISEVDLTVDQENRQQDDPCYDWQFESNNRVFVECDGLYSIEGGHATSIKLEDNDDISITAEGNESNITYEDECVCHDAYTYANILDRLETMVELGMIK